MIDRLNAVLTLLNEGLRGALVVDGPEGIAKAAWVPIDRVLLARDRLSLIINQADAFDALEGRLTDEAMRDLLVVLPPPPNFAAYSSAVRDRLLDLVSR